MGLIVPVSKLLAAVFISAGSQLSANVLIKLICLPKIKKHWQRSCSLHIPAQSISASLGIDECYIALFTPAGGNKIQR